MLFHNTIILPIFKKLINKAYLKKSLTLNGFNFDATNTKQKL